MKRNLKSLFSLIALSSLTLVSTQSMAGTFASETTTAYGTTLNLVLPVNLPATTAADYWTGMLNITVSPTQGGSGSTFQGFCIDPFQYSSTTAGDYVLSSDLSSALGTTKAGLVSNLYSNSFASTSGSVANSEAFQLALWDLAKDNGILASGSVQITGSTDPNVINLANSMITAAKAGAGSSQYSFSLYTSATAQDYLVASVTAVPEPETYAMMLAGMGLLGFTARRRTQATSRV
jgi:hypothetical protein